MTEHARAHHGNKASVRPLRILLSYYYYQGANLEETFKKYFDLPYPEVFLDCGAYTAYSQGATINCAEYCAFIRKYKHLFSIYSNLDVIGSAYGTYQNQVYMEAQGLTPLPVFHTGEDWQYLETYIERYPFIALGGMVSYMRSTSVAIMPWLIRAFKMAQGKSVYHGFGCTSWEVIKALPWYSVDSSSWGQGFKFGYMPVFDNQGGKFVKVQWGNHKECYTHGPLFRALGYDPSDFAETTRRERDKVAALSARSYMQAEAWLEKRHGVVSIQQRSAA